jgi:CRP-like cAMP-binding protein
LGTPSAGLGVGAGAGAAAAGYIRVWPSAVTKRRAESGERVVVEGEPAGGLFLIVLGSVEISKRVSDSRSVLLATLGEGAYFGEMSLLRGGVANATVTAVGPTELAVMSPRDFYAVIANNPHLWNEVRREANRRQLETNQIVTGETNLV